MGTFCRMKKKPGLIKNLFSNLRFLKMGKIGTYIFLNFLNIFFTDSHKKFPQLYAKNTKFALKKF